MAKHEELPPNQGDILTETGRQRQRRLDRRTFIRSGLAVGAGLVASAYVKPNLQSIGIARAFASVTPPPHAKVCVEVCIDFNEFAEGEIITRGKVSGVTVSTKAKDGTAASTTAGGYGTASSVAHPAMIFDSSPADGMLSGGDTDLGTPNQLFGGQGGPNNEPTNTVALGKVLIIAERQLNVDPMICPDVEADGGRLVFEFDQEVQIVSVQVVDIGDNGSAGENKVETFSTTGFGGTPLSTAVLFDLPHNSVETVFMGIHTNVRRMEVRMAGSGAVSEICYIKCQ